ncbi:hypothetical protein Tco_0321849 [Tanacetum coccineum]
MSQAIPQATIVSEEELVPSDNRLKITKNNQRITLDSNIADLFVKLVVSILKHHKLYKPISLTMSGKNASFDKPMLQIMWGIEHSANLDYALVIWDEFEWQAINRMTKQTKLPYPCLIKLIIDHLLSTNKSLARRSDVFMHSKEQDSLLSNLTYNVDGVLKFGKNLPYFMINDAIKQLAGYRVYKSKKEQSDKDTD